MNTNNMEKLGNMGLDWLDEDNSDEYDWFDKMVNARQDLKDDETSQEGSTIVFAKQLKVSLKTDKLTKSDIKRIKKEGFNMLKKSFTSNIEFEYHLEQVSLAMSDEIDWENPKLNVDPATSFFMDYTKPLPIPNGDALWKCILEGPYTLSTVIILAVPATYDSPKVPERTSVGANDPIIGVDDGTKSVGDLHLLRDDPAEYKDEFSGLSDESHDDDTDVVGG
nr:hypothetical protein [Tanacetum cinerariifolium]